jgi:hypothetical protein
MATALNSKAKLIFVATLRRSGLSRVRHESSTHAQYRAITIILADLTRRCPGRACALAREEGEKVGVFLRRQLLVVVSRHEAEICLGVLPGLKLIVVC